MIIVITIENYNKNGNNNDYNANNYDNKDDDITFNK